VNKEQSGPVQFARWAFRSVRKGFDRSGGDAPWPKGLYLRSQILPEKVAFYISKGIALTFQAHSDGPIGHTLRSNFKRTRDKRLLRRFQLHRELPGGGHQCHSQQRGWLVRVRRANPENSFCMSTVSA